jgi:hypothetical protein
MTLHRYLSPRVLLLGTALLLSPFYSAVGYLAGHPSVSTEYKLYYLKRKLRTWPGQGGLLYRPGERLNFAKQLPYLSRTGWSDPESWGTWTDGNAASLFVVLPVVPTTDMELRLEGHGFVDAQHPVQSVFVFVNGKQIGVLNYASSKTLSNTLVVPRAVFVDRNVEIELMPRNVIAPSDAGASKDTRRLGLGVGSIELRPI